MALAGVAAGLAGSVLAGSVLAGSLLACSLIVAGDLTGGTPSNTFGEEADSRAPDSATDGDALLEPEAGNPSYVAAILADGPVAYWRLGEKTGATSAKSEVGAVGCALNGPMTWEASGAIARDANTALRLDGNGALDCADRFDFPGALPYTLEVWVHAETIDTTYRFVFTKRDEAAAGGTAAYAMWLHQPEGLGFERLFDGKSKLVSMPFATGTAFHHVVGVYSGTELQLYLDGEFVTNAPDARSSPPISAPLAIGSLSLGTSSGFVGALDEAAIYEKALSPERIRAHYQAAGR
ncbi:Autotransporter adhesin [Labilithrix luteola]|uniref:Autotransporter adhesin n=1 Tax=Labilithrix luteola TaxID=1391654 RepID=A0A0K1Q7Y9_9BACT|nr:Autotransporter adhesin [Labilithrix luteola]